MRFGSFCAKSTALSTQEAIAMLVLIHTDNEWNKTEAICTCTCPQICVERIFREACENAGNWQQVHWCRNLVPSHRNSKTYDLKRLPECGWKRQRQLYLTQASSFLVTEKYMWRQKPFWVSLASHTSLRSNIYKGLSLPSRTRRKIFGSEPFFSFPLFHQTR